MSTTKTEKRSFWKIIFPFLIFFFLFSNNTYSEEDSCFSIHIASFKELRNANNYVNKMSKKGKFIFFVTEEVPGKGVFHRVYFGKLKDREEAVECWNDLKEEGLVSYFGIREFNEIDIIDEDPVLEDIDAASSDDFLMMDAERFVDNQDGTVTAVNDNTGKISVLLDDGKTCDCEPSDLEVIAADVTGVKEGEIEICRRYCLRNFDLGSCC